MGWRGGVREGEGWGGGVGWGEGGGGVERWGGGGMGRGRVEGFKIEELRHDSPKWRSDSNYMPQILLHI